MKDLLFIMIVLFVVGVLFLLGCWLRDLVLWVGQDRQKHRFFRENRRGVIRRGTN